MKEIIDNEKIPWPSRLVDLSYKCLKWAFIIFVVGLPCMIFGDVLGLEFLEVIGISGIAIFAFSFPISFILSLIATLGMPFYGFRKCSTRKCINILIFTLVACALGYAILQPALAKSRMVAKHIYCEKHLKGISNAIRIYAHENNDQFPAPEEWCDLILESPGGFNEKAFWCRAEPKRTFSYAINKYLYQIEPNEVSSDIVLLFEANLGRNGVGGPDDVTLRHKKDYQLGCYISFSDGRVEFITAEDIPNLRWTVEE